MTKANCLKSQFFSSVLDYQRAANFIPIIIIMYVYISSLFSHKCRSVNITLFERGVVSIKITAYIGGFSTFQPH